MMADKEIKLHHMDIEKYIEERVDEQQKYHSKKASKYKKKYFFFQILILSLTASISIFTYFFRTFPEQDWIGMILILISPIIILLTALNVLLKSQDLWLQYCQISEELKKHKFLFTTSSGLYRVENQKSRENLFVTNIENIISDSNLKWVAIEIENGI